MRADADTKGVDNCQLPLMPAGQDSANGKDALSAGALHEIFEDYVLFEEFCEAIGISHRTGERRIREGLPCIKFGSKRLIPVKLTRQYLLTLEKPNREPPQRGRPARKRYAN